MIFHDPVFECLDRYYSQQQRLQALIDNTEDNMVLYKKDAAKRAKIYVHPDMVDEFLVILAYADSEGLSEAKVIMGTMGLSDKHMIAIRDDDYEMQKKLREESDDDYQYGKEIMNDND